jgi:hypothetical protein
MNNSSDGTLATNTRVFKRQSTASDKSASMARSFGEVNEGNAIIQGNSLSDTKVIDDSEAHLIIALFISTLEELESNKEIMLLLIRFQKAC